MTSTTATRTADVKQEASSLYAKHNKIYPKKVSGRWRRIKWAAMALLLGIYYVLPWIRWDRGPNAPDQAVLLDLNARRFYLFFIELWPQQIYYLTGALVLGAVGLFLATSLAGRVWCGFSCPQTVWTDLFVWVERLFEGDRGDRIRLDRSPWTFNKLWRKAAKNIVWLLIALATGGAWIFYYVDAPTLARELLAFEASSTTVGFILLFTATTYVLAGFAREQVCIYMCPWPRFQAAMQDEESLIVTYQEWRGEGRAHVRKSQSWDERTAAGLGDCIDCNACFHACPTGVDIRNGNQLACIGCGLCIDACDDIMGKIGRPKSLVTFDTASNQLSLARTGKPATYKLVRPRTVIYSLILVVVGAAILVGMIFKPSLDISVLRDRAPLFVALSDGSLRNAYTFKISNMTRDPRDYVLSAHGLTAIELAEAGEHQSEQREELHLTAAPDTVATYRIFVTVPAASARVASQPLTFSLTAANGDTATYDTVFMAPER